MKKILFFTWLLPISLFSQDFYDWELQYYYTSITTDTRDIGLYITGLESASFDQKFIEVVADQFSDKIQCETIGFSQKGLLVKIHIGKGRELIGKDRILLIRRTDTNVNFGKIKVSIGSKAPTVESILSYGTLRIGTNETSFCEFSGRNLDGVFEVITVDNLVTVDSILSKSHTTSRIEVAMRPNDSQQHYYTKYKFVYWGFDSGTKDIAPITTSEFSAGIQLRNTSIIDLLPGSKNFFLSDIVMQGGELTLPIQKSEAMIEQVDFRNIQLVQGDLISDNSWVEFTGQNSSKLHLFFENYESLTPGRKHIKLKTLGPNQREYKVSINILSNPLVEDVYGKNGDLKFILSKEHRQLLKIEGERLQDLFLVSSEIATSDNEQTFQILRTLNLDNMLVFEIQVLREDLVPQEYFFKLIRGNIPNETVIDQFGLDFEKPRIPQDIKSLLVCKSGSNILQLDKDMEEMVLDGREDLIISFDPSKLRSSFGEQSFKVVVNYYNPDGSIIASEIRRSNDGSENILVNNSVGRHGDYDIILPFKYNANDYIRIWGHAEIIISHSPDFYRQELGRKDTYIQKIRFVGKNRTSVTAALTIPPALTIYGKNEEHRIELLPINVGFGLRFDFRKSESFNYAKRRIAAGLYMAGINFAGAQRSTEEGQNSFIKQGDIAFMGLLEYHLRRADNFVKIPVFIGPGLALPINGASARGFIAFGVGVNL